MRWLLVPLATVGCSLTTSLDGVFGPPVDASVEATPCGTEGAACCAANVCGTGLECRTGECQPPLPCGGDGEGCCAGASCSAGLRCEAEVCSPIPPPPKPDPCGAVGQACCDGTACNPGNVCSTGKCVACGSYGQLCCPGGGCRGDTNCVEAGCRACCAKCKNRELYHRVFVAFDCTEAARKYCSSGDRGGLGDAKWGTCQAF